MKPSIFKLDFETVKVNHLYSLDEIKTMAGALGYDLVSNGNSKVSSKPSQQHPSYDKIMGLFHKAWGDAKESPEYNKETFINLQCEIFKLLGMI